MRKSVLGVGCLTALLPLVAASCGSSSPPPAGPPSIEAAYLPTGPGLITQVGFSDPTHYWLHRIICPGMENGCTDTGTYAIDHVSNVVTFNSDSGYTTSFPFQVTATGPAGSVASADLRLEGDGLTSGGVQLTFDAGSGGLIATSLQLGNQNFNVAPLGRKGVERRCRADTTRGRAHDAYVPVLATAGGEPGGSVIAPKIVTVTWAEDPKASVWQDFDDSLVGSSYWSATTSEYGVGPAQSGPAEHVVVKTPAPTNFTDTSIETWIISQASSPKSGWPTPTANTFYQIFLPTSTSAHFKESGKLECNSGTLGYHSGVTINKMFVAYALMFQCSSFSTDDVTSTAAHEVVEGAADPFNNQYAYIGFDSDHLAWDILQDFQDEIADACEDFDNINTNIPAKAGGTLAAQRTWSNNAAVQGHDPCVPAPAGPYFNVSPLGMTTVTITTPPDYSNVAITGKNPATVQGLGYSIKRGQTQTVDIGLYSDQAGAGPWTISAAEGVPWGDKIKNKHVTLSFDKSSGSDGTIAKLTITVNAVNTSMNGELITITSTLNGLQHFAPILISNQ